MMDAFDGCRVYGEGVRHDLDPWRALSFLIAGDAALVLANVSDDELEQMCANALPPILGDARGLLVDRRVRRCMASVNAIPRGMPERELRRNHRPGPARPPAFSGPATTSSTRR